jgi:hypothetical protein
MPCWTNPSVTHAAAYRLPIVSRKPYCFRARQSARNCGLSANHALYKQHRFQLLDKVVPWLSTLSRADRNSIPKNGNQFQKRLQIGVIGSHTVLLKSCGFANETFHPVIGRTPSGDDFTGVPGRASRARPTDGMWLLGRHGCRYVLPINREKRRAPKSRREIVTNAPVERRKRSAISSAGFP